VLGHGRDCLRRLELGLLEDDLGVLGRDDAKTGLARATGALGFSRVIG
jgi:hypothetical protein